MTLNILNSRFFAIVFIWTLYELPKINIEAKLKTVMDDELNMSNVFMGNLFQSNSKKISQVSEHVAMYGYTDDTFERSKRSVILPYTEDDSFEKEEDCGGIELFANPSARVYACQHPRDLIYMSHGNQAAPMCLQDSFLTPYHICSVDNRDTCCKAPCRLYGCCVLPAYVAVDCSIDGVKEGQLCMPHTYEHIDISIQQFDLDIPARKGALILRKKCVQLTESFSNYMIVDYIDDQGRLKPCPEMSFDDLVTTYIPVFDIVDNEVLYKNVLCAELNGMYPTQYDFLNVTFTCPLGTQLDMFNPEFAFENCRLELEHEHFKHSPCESTMFDKCPFDEPELYRTIGEAEQIRFIREQNDSFMIDIQGIHDKYSISIFCSLLYMPMYDVSSEQLYKNGFCALCDGLSSDYIIENMSCATIEWSIEMPWPFAPRFSLIVDVDEMDIEGWAYRNQKICTGNAFFVLGTGICLPNECLVFTNASLDSSKCFNREDALNPIILQQEEEDTSSIMLYNGGNVESVIMLTLHVVAAFKEIHAHSVVNRVGQMIAQQELQQYDAEFITSSQYICDASESRLHDVRHLTDRTLYCIHFEFQIFFNKNDIRHLALFEDVLSGHRLGTALQPFLGVYLYLTQTVTSTNYEVKCGGNIDDFQQFPTLNFVLHNVIQDEWPGTGDVSFKNINVLIPELNAVFPLNHLVIQYSTDFMAANGNSGGENYGSVTQPTVFVCKTNILICESVLIDKSSYEYNISNGSKVTLTLKNKYKCKLELYLGEDILLFSNGDLQICMENVCPIPLEFLDALYSIEGVMNLIGGLLSLISYIVTLTVYLFLPSLRNTPGKCIVCLLVSMFIGHSCLLVSPFISEYDLVCMGIGATQHFAWLCAMSWMLCIAFDMLCTFRKWSASLAISSKRFRFFCAFSLLLPLAIVATYVTLMSGILGKAMAFTEFGYGGTSLCWLYPEKALFSFFIIPMTCILFINHLLIVPTAYAILKQNIFDQPRNARHNDGTAVAFKTLGKILLLSGVIWLFAVLAYTFDSLVLRMLFSFLASFQGVLLFGSFAVTTRVRKLIVSGPSTPVNCK